VRPLPGAQLKQVREELFRNYFRILMSDRISGRTVNSPEEGVIEISDQEGDSVKVFIDEKTGLLSKEVYAAGQLTGPPGTMEEIFDDFQPLGDIKAPKKITVKQDGKKFAELTIEDYKLNSGVNPQDLSKKP